MSDGWLCNCKLKCVLEMNAPNVLELSERQRRYETTFKGVRLRILIEDVIVNAMLILYSWFIWMLIPAEWALYSFLKFHEGKGHALNTGTGHIIKFQLVYSKTWNHFGSFIGIRFWYKKF